MKTYLLVLIWKDYFGAQSTKYTEAERSTVAFKFAADVTRNSKLGYVDSVNISAKGSFKFTESDNWIAVTWKYWYI